MLYRKWEFLILLTTSTSRLIKSLYTSYLSLWEELMNLINYTFDHLDHEN